MPPLPAFSQRMVENHRIAAVPPKTAGGPYVLSIVDEFLVDSSIASQVVDDINSNKVPQTGSRTAAIVGTVFEGLGVSPDVNIVKIDKITKTSPHVGGQPAVVGIVTALQRQFSPGNPRLISLNHVLVPANYGGVGCPAGAPYSIRYPPHPLPTHGDRPEMTVIDSGYNDWWGRSTSDANGAVGPWPGRNPLDQICDLVLPVNRAEYFAGSSGTSSVLAQTFANGAGSNWHRGTEDRPSTHEKGVLDALAGHANFVVGTIARHVEMPTIHLWSHNGSFVYEATGDEFPCEASVCRSIVASQKVHQTPVIHAGFAFPVTSDESSAEVTGNQLSVVWDRVFEHLGDPSPMFTCPAGNESSTDLYFPAALPTAFPSSPLFANVLGVGSMIPGTTKPSAFTNTGPWLACSAWGEHVHSPFIPVGPLRCEDDEHGTMQTFGNSWARWQGTSFAAPKIAAGIAARLMPGVPPELAWTTFKAAMSSGSDTLLGAYFEF